MSGTLLERDQRALAGDSGLGSAGLRLLPGQALDSTRLDQTRLHSGRLACIGTTGPGHELSQL